MPYRIATDIHTHTIMSQHAYSTIEENVRAASEHGLELLGSADHFSPMICAETDIRNYQHFLNVAVWPRTWMGVTLLRGAEVDVTTLDGGLFGQDIPCPLNIVGGPYRREGSLFDRVTEGLDYLVASVHNGAFTRDAPIERTTSMYLKVLEEPKVLVLGHVGRSGVPFEMDEVLGRAKELNKLIEINEHTLEDTSRPHDHCRQIAIRCAEMGVGITVSSDSHISPSIGRFPSVTKMLEEIHFPVELIKNRDRASFLNALAAAGVCDLRALADEAR